MLTNLALQQHLFDVKHQSFQVLALRMIDVDGMVGGLVQLMEDAHVAAALGSSREHRHAELVLGDRLRTGEGEEDASGTDFSNARRFSRV